jgi:alkylation response protein AidB-like acyl-CoA dehydrogenase
LGHYKSNVRDLAFNLFEVLDLEKALATGEFGDLDAESVRQMLDEASRLAEGPLAESFAEADRSPPTFDPAAHTVSLPEPFKKSLRAWQQGEWFRVGLNEDIGGVAAPAMVAWAINEFPLGAQPAAFMYMAGPIMADILYHIGSEQQPHWAAIAFERNWGATMVHTEPDAGSDVGAGRTKAIQQPDGTWHLDGVKRFITNGDTDDLFENNLPLVLARPEGAGPGTNGLSLNIVPRYLFDPETGELGDRNGVYVTGLEHKMGLKASATCELTFGQHAVPAVG